MKIDVFKSEILKVKIQNLNLKNLISLWNRTIPRKILRTKYLNVVTN